MGLYSGKQVRDVRQGHIRDDGEQRLAPFPRVQRQKYAGTGNHLHVACAYACVLRSAGERMQENGCITASVGDDVNVGVRVAREAQLYAVAGAQNAAVAELEVLTGAGGRGRSRHHLNTDARGKLGSGLHAGSQHAAQEYEDRQRNLASRRRA